MNDIFEIILLICLIICFVYIFWLHHNMKKFINIPHIRKRENNKQIMNLEKKNDDDDVLDNLSLSGTMDLQSQNSHDLFNDDSSNIE